MASKNINTQSRTRSSTALRRSIWQSFHKFKPRIAAKGTAKARKIEQEEAKRSLTSGEVIMRLLPLWALLITILLIEPTLPFLAIRSAVRRVGSLIPITTTAPPLAEPVFIVEGPQNTPTPNELPAPNWSLEISPIFTPEIQYWKEPIGQWSQTYRIKPNLIATLMQIESCGNPSAVSDANKKGLFQVPAANFQQGENTLDPEINALRGLTLFAEMLASANGDPGLSFAAYNGGQSVFYTSPAEWASETQVYQYWGGGIYDEAEMGLSESPTLQEWLDNGGGDLCRQATEMLELSPQD
ncbi:MAG: transglycosylase SLT domain-containing protein [Anaerolineae bacterium]|nr:transglycosylase SLT domain-containing protein [Anaerolineae bacterium]